MYYFKQSFFGIIYMFFLAISAFAIMLIENLTAVICLLSLNIALFAFLMFMYFMKEGEHAKQAKRANDLERKEIIRTGEPRPLKEKEEYKPWKGFFIGGLIGAPLVALLAIYAIVVACGGGVNNFVGAIANFIYAPFFSFVSLFVPDGVALTFGQYFIVLYCLPFLSAIVGVPYLIGARKQQKKYDKIMDKQRMLYGDNVDIEDKPNK